MKTLKQIREGFYSTVPEDEIDFVNSHGAVKKTADANGNGDDVFNASNVKTVKRRADHHGYDDGQDSAIYDAGKSEKTKAPKGKVAKAALKESKATPKLVHSQVHKVYDDNDKKIGTVYKDDKGISAEHDQLGRAWEGFRNVGSAKKHLKDFHDLAFKVVKPKAFNE